MLFLPNATVAEIADDALAFEAVSAALRDAATGAGRLCPVLAIDGPQAGTELMIKAGSVPGAGLIGFKAGAYWPANSEKGLPRHSSTIMLIDGETGRVAAVVEADRLNGLRTAAADAVAADLLARRDATTLGIIGAGHQAAFDVRALCHIRPIARILIASRSMQSAEAMARALERPRGPTVEVAQVEAVVRSADILVTATPSTVPLFRAEWVRPGTHVAAMGADKVGKQELPLELFRRARLYADLPAQSLLIGEFQHVRAEVEDCALTIVAIGDALDDPALGRRSADDITIFDSSGIALQDLHIAAAVVRRSGHVRPGWRR